MKATGALARRAFADSRIRTLAFAYLFLAVAYIQPATYRHAYPTVADRLAFAHSFASNKAVVLFYGKAYNLLTVGGYSAWRVGGTLAIFAAVWGMLAAVRALRAEEEAGRTELVLAAGISRRTAYLSNLLAIGAGMMLLWLAEFAGSLAGRLPVAGSAYLALATASVIPVFVGVGALASQLAPTRRAALELSSGIVGICLLLRVIADTSAGAGWLRWATPLGWAEELRPFTSTRPLVLLLPLATAGVLLFAAERIAAARDVGSGVFAARDASAARATLLSSPTAHALRSERGSLIVWVLSVSGFAFIIGVISNSISSAGISKSLQRELAKLGTGSVLTPKGYIGFSFVFFVLVISLFCCTQLGAARHEEATQRLETLLAQPLERRSWLGGRLVLAVSAAVLLSLTAGAFGWLGAVIQGVRLPLPQMLEAGFNCVPAALFFLGVAALAYALMPRASAGVSYGLLTIAFLWQLFGALLGAPRWLAHLTPFAHVAAVPARPFKLGAAAVLLAAGLLGCIVSLTAFARRDLVET